MSTQGDSSALNKKQQFLPLQKGQRHPTSKTNTKSRLSWCEIIQLRQISAQRRMDKRKLCVYMYMYTCTCSCSKANAVTPQAFAAKRKYCAWNLALYAFIWYDCYTKNVHIATFIRWKDLLMHISYDTNCWTKTGQDENTSSFRRRTTTNNPQNNDNNDNDDDDDERRRRRRQMVPPESA